VSLTTTYYQTNLETDITYLKGVGPQRGNALKKYGIENVGHLLYHFPRKYLDRTTIKSIQETKIGEEAVIIGRVESFGMKQARKRRYFQMLMNDHTGYLTCLWFNSIVVCNCAFSSKLQTKKQSYFGNDSNFSYYFIYSNGWRFRSIAHC